MMGANQKDMMDFEDDLMSGKLPSPLTSPSKQHNQTTNTTSLLDTDTDQEAEPTTEATSTTTTEEPRVMEEEEVGDQGFGAFNRPDTAAKEQDGRASANEDEFGDFGTTTSTATAAATMQDPFDTTSHDNDDNDDFGDFGGGPATTAGNDDDDEFGDFGGAPMAGGGNDDDDDDFGDFGDFKVQQAGDDDEFGDFGEFTAGASGGDDFDFEQGTAAAAAATESSMDAFGDEQASNGGGETDGAAPAEALPVPAVAPETLVEPSPDFNAVNSRQVENHVLAQLEKIFPLENKDAETNERQQKQKELLAQYDTESGSVLAEQELWKLLSEQSTMQGGGAQGKSPSTAPQFQWKYSHLRKEYYASLGLATVNDQTAVPASSIPGHVASTSSVSSSPKSRTASPLMMAPERTQERRALDIAAARAYCNFTRELLGSYSGEEMKEIISRLTDLTKHASEELTYWLDQREQMAMDSERYNGMIASLVGRAAKLKESESKQASKAKRLTRSSFNLMSSS